MNRFSFKALLEVGFEYICEKESRCSFANVIRLEAYIKIGVFPKDVRVIADLKGMEISRKIHFSVLHCSTSLFLGYV